MERAKEVLEHFIQKATIFNAHKLTIELVFSLNRNRTIGECRYISKGKYLIRLHGLLYEKYKDEYLLHVVPHELAHAIVIEKYGRRAKPHGVEFKSVLEFLEGAKISKKERPKYTILHNKPTSKKRHKYICECERTHYLSTILHNRIERKTHKYICKICKKELIFLTTI